MKKEKKTKNIIQWGIIRYFDKLMEKHIIRFFNKYNPKEGKEIYEFEHYTLKIIPKDSEDYKDESICC